MAEEHKEQFRTYARFTAKLLLDVGITIEKRRNENG
jgi:hypothetical protein